MRKSPCLDFVTLLCDSPVERQGVGRVSRRPGENATRRALGDTGGPPSCGVLARPRGTRSTACRRAANRTTASRNRGRDSPRSPAGGASTPLEPMPRRTFWPTRSSLGLDSPEPLLQARAADEAGVAVASELPPREAVGQTHEDGLERRIPGIGLGEEDVGRLQRASRRQSDRGSPAAVGSTCRPSRFRRPRVVR